jgi:ADP-ribose pyrophosphatase YjhB (NUDIX family)
VARAESGRYQAPNRLRGESIQPSDRQPGEGQKRGEGVRARTSYHATDPTAIRLSVSAVVWREGGGSALLLMQRSDNGAWGLPGGYVEAGESVAAAAAREVLEETGVRVAVGRLVGVYSDPAVQVIAYPDGRRVHAVNLCFEAAPLAAAAPTTPQETPTTAQETPTTAQETLATGWFSAAALPDPFVPIHTIRIRDALDGDRAARIR